MGAFLPEFQSNFIQIGVRKPFLSDYIVYLKFEQNGHFIDEKFSLWVPSHNQDMSIWSLGYNHPSYS